MEADTFDWGWPPPCYLFRRAMCPGLLVTACDKNIKQACNLSGFVVQAGRGRGAVRHLCSCFRENG